jgi:pimeloyl-ACP methyl ester carboxylesterase
VRIGKVRKNWKRSAYAAAAAITLAAIPDAVQAQELKLVPGQRVLKSGERLDYEAGTLFVPEHHGKAGGKVIAVPFERYRARHPSGASPIFFLAGGPGDSALDRLDKPSGQSDVAFYSEFADVVFLDQRGGGRSLPHMTCPDTAQLPLDRPVKAETRIAATRKIALACRDYWTGRGVDLTAYSTTENGDDVIQLAKVLGYNRISLVGGSYGSHLGLSLIRRHPEILDRVVLRGIEGPDDTYDVPSGTLGALSRIAAAAEASPELAGEIPPGGLIAALKAVEQRLDANPVTVIVKGKSITLGGDDVRGVARHGAREKTPWPAYIIRMYRGDYSQLAKDALEDRTVGIEGPMHFMMDCASGISAERKRKILADPAQQVLGNINEEYFATCDIWNAPDLGAEFRSPVRSNIPILIFQGTWDTNTPMENAETTATWFPNGALIHVLGGTHPVLDELYRSWTPMRPAIRTFLEGGKPEIPATIVLPQAAFDKPAK